MLRPFFLALLLLFIVPADILAQHGCPAPANLTPDPSALLFTPQQEEILGDIMAEHVQFNFPVIDDEEVTAYMNRIGQQVAGHFPDSGLHFRFFLLDQPILNAFGMPGGRIYLSRKMVAFLRNEDELAGLLGHELGHQVARQPAVHLSGLFRQFFGPVKIGDRQDLFEKYNEIIENSRTKKWKGTSEGESRREQLVADHAALLAVVQAGYSPLAFVDFFDRFAETKGKTGNWFTDFLNTTRPESKRIREMLKEMEKLPADCRGSARGPQADDDFRRWQAAVLHYSGIGHRENLSGLLWRKKLDHPLQPDVDHFQFSPDGKFLLAQDSGGISVLTRDPLAFQFYIDAPDSFPAQFSADSRQIVFLTKSWRVEAWDIYDRQLDEANEVMVRNGCMEHALSPDGQTLACMEPEYLMEPGWTLTLFDTTTSEPLFRKNHFYEPQSFFELFLILIGNWNSNLDFATTRLRFSPDSRYFAAASIQQSTLAFDLSSKKEVKLSGAVRRHLNMTFSFTGPDQIAGMDTEDPRNGAVVQFPSGPVLREFPFGQTRISPTENPRFLAIRPVKDRPVGIYDLEEKKVVYRNRTSALDIWGTTLVSERLNGEIGLYEFPKTVPSKILSLTASHLGRMRTTAVSGDLHWLAMSGQMRGAVWDLENNRQAIYVRGFDHSYFAGNGELFLNFPKFENAERQLIAVRFGLSGPSSRPLNETNPKKEGAQDGPHPEADAQEEDSFYGAYTLRTERLNKSDQRKNIRLAAYATDSGKPLWNRVFPKEAPWIDGSAETGRVVLRWSAKTGEARNQIAGNPRLARLAAESKPGDSDLFLEVLDGITGEVLGGAIVRTGKYSFHIENAQSAGPYLILEDSQHRVLLYSLETGQPLGKIFGSYPVVSPSANLLCVSGERGELMLYDLPSLKEKTSLLFANRTVLEAFSKDGSGLLVLTGDQTAFRFDVNAISSAESEPH